MAAEAINPGPIAPGGTVPYEGPPILPIRPEGRTTAGRPLGIFVSPVGNNDPKKGRTKDALLTTGATAAVVAGAPGVYEATWAATLTTAATTTHNPYLATGLIAAATFAIESASAIGAARLLANEKSNRVLAWLRRGLGKIGLKETVQTNPIVDLAIAFPLGTASMAIAKQSADPARTERQNRRYGLKMAAAVTALAAPVNYAIAEGAMNPGDTPKVAAAFGSVALLAIVGKRFKRFARKRAAKAEDQDVIEGIDAAPNYDLSEAECDLIKKDLVRKVRAAYGNTIAALWIDGRRPEANLLRTREKQTFPKIDTEALFGQYDESNMFLAIVDARRGKSGVIRGTRLSGRHFDPRHKTNLAPNVERDGGTGMAMFRDMIVDGELSGQEVAEYYRNQDIDLSECVSVETNFKIERARRRWAFIPMSRLAYLAMYNYVRKGDLKGGNTRAIFAHINDASRDSLSRLGVTLDYIAGRADLRTPAGPGSEQRYDDKFTPVALLDTPQTKRSMRKPLIAAPYELYLTTPHAV